MKFTSVVLALLIACGTAGATEKSSMNKAASPFDQSSELLLPANYRSWVAVAPTTPGMPAHTRQHLISKIYVEPASYESFVKHGVWPNRTMIVLELRDTAAFPRNRCDGVVGLEVAAKDDQRGLDPWSYYGIIYEQHKPAAKSAEAKRNCGDCSGSPTDMRLAMYFPTLRAVIDATPRTMQPSAF